MRIKQLPRSQSLILLDRRPGRRAAAFARLQPQIVSSVAELHDSMTHAAKDAIWVSYASDLTGALLKRAAEVPARLGGGLFVHALELKSIPVLSNLFRRVAFSLDDGFIPAEELAEVLSAENRANLFIGGFVNASARAITFWRGNLDSLTVPFTAFETAGDGTRPDFGDFAVIDSGQTVKLGDYEAAVDAILYEYDSDYRREISQKRLQEDRSFGAALRRLRKQRGLRREDFEPDVAAKTIARIEQGVVNRIHKRTLQALAKHLGVKSEEIAEF